MPPCGRVCSIGYGSVKLSLTCARQYHTVSESFLDTQPDCTRFHAWMVEDWTDFAWRKTLVDLRDASQDVRLSPPDEGTVHLFTDGGCLFPSIPRFRLASWAFCVASLVDGTFLPGASGLLEGPFQTSLRAEIRAAIEAIQYAILHRRKFLIWTDNQHVYKRIKTVCQWT